MFLVNATSKQAISTYDRCSSQSQPLATTVQVTSPSLATPASVATQASSNSFPPKSTVVLAAALGSYRDRSGQLEGRSRPTDTKYGLFDEI
ncbi:hypothetical protein JCGZ_01798 [Jatropha curcas]|uniref:Uncharacterized protein n=1 Tax=Jatropha curcas TaxID=180498 RepID=A0A067LEM9_JATCU|nr:hypothetical protein JCGZ_01798 [Jatropha curcas]